MFKYVNIITKEVNGSSKLFIKLQGTAMNITKMPEFYPCKNNH